MTTRSKMAAVLMAVCMSVPAFAAATKDAIPTVQPAQLASELSAKKPLHIYQVGFRVLYAQAHIPGSVYVGAGRDAAGIDALRAAVKNLPKDAPIVLYCGCCPWARCPNVLPAYDALAALHFTHVRVLAIPENFGADWVNKGYPVERGEAGHG